MEKKIYYLSCFLLVFISCKKKSNTYNISEKKRTISISSSYVDVKENISEKIPETINSDYDLIDFYFDYGKEEKNNFFETSILTNEYKILKNKLQKYIKTYGGYEKIFFSNFFLRNENIYIPNDIDLSNKIVRITFENYELFKGHKYWGDGTTRIIETRYYFFDENEIITDVFYVYDPQGQSDYLRCNHLSYKLEDSIFTFTQNILGTEEKTIFNYKLSYNPQNIEFELMNSEANNIKFIISENKFTSISKDKNERINFTEVLFTNEGKKIVESYKEPDTDNIYVKSEKSFERGLINKNSNLDKNLEVVYGKNGEIKEIFEAPGTNDEEGEYKKTEIVILDNVDSYLSNILNKYEYKGFTGDENKYEKEILLSKNKCIF